MPREPTIYICMSRSRRTCTAAEPGVPGHLIPAIGMSPIRPRDPSSGMTEAIAVDAAMSEG